MGSRRRNRRTWRKVSVGWWNRTCLEEFEVKVGTSALTPTERSVMHAVREGRVATEVWQIGERGPPIVPITLAGDARAGK
jgi:hypothetical protein